MKNTLIHLEQLALFFPSFLFLARCSFSMFHGCSTLSYSGNGTAGLLGTLSLSLSRSLFFEELQKSKKRKKFLSSLVLAFARALSNSLYLAIASRMIAKEPCLSLARHIMQRSRIGLALSVTRQVLSSSLPPSLFLRSSNASKLLAGDLAPPSRLLWHLIHAPELTGQR